MPALKSSKKIFGICLYFTSSLIFAESTGLIGLVDNIAQSTGQIAKSVIHGTGKALGQDSQEVSNKQFKKSKYKNIAKKNKSLNHKKSIASLKPSQVNQNYAQSNNPKPNTPPATTENFVMPNNANTSSGSTTNTNNSNNSTPASNQAQTPNTPTQNNNPVLNTNDQKTNTNMNSTTQGNSSNNPISNTNQGNPNTNQTTPNLNQTKPSLQDSAPLPTGGKMPEVSAPSQDSNTSKQSNLPDLSDPETTSVSGNNS